MKKTGFTLVELLATLIVVVIILTITVPRISGLIQSGKKNSFKSNAELLVRTVEKKRFIGNYDVSKLSVDTIEEDVNVSNENYESVSAYIDGNKTYIYLVGKKKWEGLGAFGKAGDMYITDQIQQMYYAKETEYKYVDASTELVLSHSYDIGDDPYIYGYEPLNLGFDVNIGGKLYSKIYVSAPGYITFEEKDILYDMRGPQMSTWAVGFPIIVPYMGSVTFDKLMQPNSGVFYEFGVENNQKYVLIEYRDVVNMMVNNPSLTGGFEVKIYEDGVIKMFFKNVVFGNYPYNNGGDSVVGVYVNNANYVQYSSLEQKIQNNMGIVYTPKLGFVKPVKPIAVSENCFVFNTKTKTITDYQGVNELCPSNIIIPNTINGIPIENIGINAFRMKGIMSVILPSGLKKINNYAFSSNGLKSIVIPDTVTDIGQYAFETNALESVILPSGITKINNYAFSLNKLKQVTIPNSVTSIGDCAFCDNQLGSLTIPTGVTSIGYYAFASNRLKNINLPSSLTSIATESFNDNLLPDSQAFIYARNSDGSKDYTTLVSYGGERKSNVVIPNGVVSLGSYALAYNGLTSVTIPNTVVNIYEGAFWDNFLTSIAIPNSVVNLGDYAFERNQLISVTIGSGINYIGEGAFQFNQLANVTIPNNVIGIGVGAFQTNLITNVTIPTSVTSIGITAFNDNLLPDNQAFIYARNPDGSSNYTTLIGYGGAKRSGVVIPSGVTTIGDNAFENNRLTSVTIPNGVVSIGVKSFQYNQLTNLAIPNSVTSIGKYAFYNNPTLSKVTIDNTSGAVTIGSRAFGSVTPTYLR
jgi:prepilin-type N-terminal cleavage/methylation domain-containing protein